MSEGVAEQLNLSGEGVGPDLGKHVDEAVALFTPNPVPFPSPRPQEYLSGGWG
jgi:hypothetical protein